MINRGVLILSKLSTFSKDFLFNSLTGSIPGLITLTFSLSVPLLIAKFFVYSELAITFSALLRTLIALLFSELPLG